MSVYRRYEAPPWYDRQVRRAPTPRPAPPEPTPEPDSRPAPPPRPSRPGPQGGLAGTLGRLLPEGPEAGDLFLIAMLLFLYAESRDEDFLIILAAAAFSMLKRE